MSYPCTSTPPSLTTLYSLTPHSNPSPCSIRMVVEPTPPSVRKKEPHEILSAEVKQLNSVDQLLDADLTWLHMRPLYDPRNVDKRAESPTLVKG